MIIMSFTERIQQKLKKQKALKDRIKRYNTNIIRKLYNRIFKNKINRAEGTIKL